MDDKTIDEKLHTYATSFRQEKEKDLQKFYASCEEGVRRAPRRFLYKAIAASCACVLLGLCFLIPAVIKNKESVIPLSVVEKAIVAEFEPTQDSVSAGNGFSTIALTLGSSKPQLLHDELLPTLPCSYIRVETWQYESQTIGCFCEAQPQRADVLRIFLWSFGDRQTEGFEEYGTLNESVTWNGHIFHFKKDGTVTLLSITEGKNHTYIKVITEKEQSIDEILEILF